MLEGVIRDSERNAIVIDCRELLNTSTDSALVMGLAAQTGYWPIFTFLNSMNNLIDIASVGIIGQKGAIYLLLHVEKYDHFFQRVYQVLFLNNSSKYWK